MAEVVDKRKFLHKDGEVFDRDIIDEYIPEWIKQTIDDASFYMVEIAVKRLTDVEAIKKVNKAISTGDSYDPYISDEMLNMKLECDGEECEDHECCDCHLSDCRFQCDDCDFSEFCTQIEGNVPEASGDVKEEI